MNFDQLLTELRKADEGLGYFQKEEFKELIGDVQDKVDGIKYFITKCESEITRLDSIIKEFQEQKQAVKNSMENLKKWTIDCMVKNDTPFLKGNLFSVKLQERESFLINENIQLDAKAYLTYKGLVLRDYKWNKKAAKEAVKKGEFSNIGEIVKNKHTVFRALKELK